MESESVPVNEGNDEVRFGIRPATIQDMDFVVDSWRRSYDDSPHARCPGGLKEYIATQRQVIDQCLKTSRVLVAYPEAPECVPEQIMGWLCHRGSVLHYVYVKAPFRQHGIALALFAAAGRDNTQPWFSSHLVPSKYTWTSWKGLSFLAMPYNPALIFGGSE